MDTYAGNPISEKISSNIYIHYPLKDKYIELKVNSKIPSHSYFIGNQIELKGGLNK